MEYNIRLIGRTLIPNKLTKILKKKLSNETRSLLGD